MVGWMEVWNINEVEFIKDFCCDFCFWRLRNPFDLKTKSFLIYFYVLNVIFIWTINFQASFIGMFFSFVVLQCKLCHLLRSCSCRGVFMALCWPISALIFYVLISNVFVLTFQCFDQCLYITKSSGQFPQCPCLTYEKHGTLLVTASPGFQDTAFSSLAFPPQLPLQDRTPLPNLPLFQSPRIPSSGLFFFLWTLPACLITSCLMA